MFGIAALIALLWVWPSSWLVAIPTVLPVMSFAPWTGWITFEEIDILVLAAAAGGYARAAWARSVNGGLSGARRRRPVLPLLAWLLIGLFVLSTLVAMVRGFADAGGFKFGWFQGYHEPMNSVRLAKSFFEALLLLPLWRIAYKQNPQRAQNLLSLGLMLGLALASLATVWERVAFTGLLNFSSDYRTTAMFWEMHVGGAALDGFLALTVPFAVRELLQARSPVRFGLAGAVAALASYACLTTFSRGVYVAVPVGLAILFALEALQRRRATASNLNAPVAPGISSRWLTGALLVLGFSVSAGWMFQTSGYRGAGALLGALALMLPLARVFRSMPQSHWIAGGLGGLLVATLAVGVAWLVPKGAYVAYVAAFAATAWMVWTHQQRATSSSSSGPISLAGFVGTTVGVVLVAGNWGGAAAVGPAAGAAILCLLLAVGAGAARRPFWPEATGWQSGVVCSMGVAVAVVGIFSGGAYMGDRFSTGGRDLDTRLTHWKLGVDMLQTPSDWWLGKGLGRFPANHFLLGDPKEHPGDFRLRQEKNESYLRLTGGLHLLGHGQLFRATQRVSVPDSPARASAQIRTAKDVNLNFEVCEKHLLYNAGCLERTVTVKASPGKWQTLVVALQGDTVSRGAWYAPKLLTFSISLESAGSSVDLDQLKLFGPDGRNLLVNGDFSEEMAHWFFSSDKFHLPWHMKNMFLHVLFDQGILGLALWSLLVGGALTRLTIGKARAHPMAPAVVASLMGFAIVGLFDSLLDVPRVAMLFYLLVLIGITVKIAAPQDEATPAALVKRNGSAGNNPPTQARQASALRRITKTLMVIVMTGLLATGAAGLASFSMGRSPMDWAKITPAEWIRVAKPWLIENEILASALLPPLEWLQSTIERTPPEEALPTLGKGQQARSLPTQRFKSTGEPVPLESFIRSAISEPSVIPNAKAISVNELARAIEQAQAGQVIEIAPGHYRVNQKLTTRRGGTAGQPITVRADKPGTVLIEFNTVEGFHVTQPYWIFENLTVRGVCQRDADCEHAFHIVGAAQGVVLRNNRMEDFNAHIKVNGEGGQWPDNGLVQYNTLTNSHPRTTESPVTPFDLVAASHWQVADNLVTDFVHAGGNQVSYGVFMKGAGTQGRIERNLIVCTSKHISQDGNRIGMSWGGGGTAAGYACRDQICASEHAGGLAANNVVAHCNDAGIDVNRSSQIALAHNTLINTAGVLIRGQSEEVRIYGNLLDGQIQSKDGVRVTPSMNQIATLKKVFLDPDRLRLERTSSSSSDTPSIPQAAGDFCHRPRGTMTWAGATGSGPLPCITPEP